MSTAQHATEQRQRVLEVLNRERQIASAASEISANSRVVSEQTEAASQAIEAGTVTIEATNRSMAEMVSTVAAGADLMQECVARMAEVNRIVEEISGLARQTNLLALNAAIEAAHAGKEGDGFSVIAHEIRALADRAGKSTKEIEEKISQMSVSALSAAGAMQTGHDAAQASISENAKVQSALESIRGAMHEVQRRSAEVADSSERQIEAGRAVTESVTKVDLMASKSSLESDAAAEMSIRLVIDAEALLADMRGSTASGIEGRKMTDRIVSQMKKQQAEILAALAALRSLCSQAGPAQVSGHMQVKASALPGLRFGLTLAVDADPIVDQVHSGTRCGATIFVADGDKLIRAATNVKLADGQRATGTELNPLGLAIRSLREGKNYFGVVYVLGNPFVAAYEPLLSAGGQLIGAIYVGRPLQIR